MRRQCSPVFLAAVLVSSACAQDDFVRLPSRTTDVTDPTTGIPVRVQISAFAIAAREVTQSEYARLVGSTPSAHKGDQLPVENVTWWDAIRYCNLRSVKEGLQACYDLTTGR